MKVRLGQFTLLALTFVLLRAPEVRGGCGDVFGPVEVSSKSGLFRPFLFSTGYLLGGRHRMNRLGSGASIRFEQEYQFTSDEVPIKKIEMTRGLRVPGFLVIDKLAEYTVAIVATEVHPESVGGGRMTAYIQSYHSHKSLVEIGLIEYGERLYLDVARFRYAKIPPESIRALSDAMALLQEIEATQGESIAW